MPYVLKECLRFLTVQGTEASPYRLHLQSAAGTRPENRKAAANVAALQAEKASIQRTVGVRQATLGIFRVRSDDCVYYTDMSVSMFLNAC